MPALLMRTSRDSTLSTAPLMCAALVTSRVRGVTRPSECAKGWRVPAYTRFAPLLKASSTSARPMPRLAPVIKTVLLSMFITFSFRSWLVIYFLLAITDRSAWRIRPTTKIFVLCRFGFPKAQVGAYVPAVPFSPAAHTPEWSNECQGMEDTSTPMSNQSAHSDVFRSPATLNLPRDGWRPFALLAG